MSYKCLSILVLVTIFDSYGQDALKKPILPLTPNAASLGKFGDIPIGLYTGQPSISIPFFQIDYPNLSVPISLVYSYNGLKVEEYPGWVGTGWTLTGTGVVNRQQRGLPDESINGYNGQYRSGEKVMEFINSGAYINTRANATTADLATFSSWIDAPQNAEMVNFLSNVKDGQADSEPDMFIFNIPGYSGKFFFDHTQCGSTQKSAVVIPHQNLKVKGNFNYSGRYSGNFTTGVIESFEITDERGNVYQFNQLEVNEFDRLNADTGQREIQPTNNTWYLSQITDVFGNEILYSYDSRTIDNPPTVREELVMPLEASGGIPQIYYSKTSEAVLTRIDFRNGYIDFVEQQTSRLDWNSSLWPIDGPSPYQPKALEFVRVNIENNLVKEFFLEYDYFGANARLKLEKVTEQSGGQKKSPYVFAYHDFHQFPRIGLVEDLYSQDHWGYYTGQRHSTLLPPYGVVNNDGAIVPTSGNPRTPAPEAAKAGILTRVEYPTGGFTEFSYEPNEYDGDLVESPVDFNLCAGEFSQVGEVLDVRLSANELGSDTDPQYNKTSQITLPTTVCARVNVTANSSRCAESGAWAKLRLVGSGQEYISVHMNPAGEISYGAALYQPHETFTLPAGTYELSVGVENYPGGCPANAWDNYATIGLLVANSSGTSADIKRFSGGLRVSKVVDCAASPCSGCTTKLFDYKDIIDPTKPSGRLITTPKYVNRQKIIVGNGTVWLYDVEGDVVSSGSNVPVVGTQGSTVGYQYVTVFEETEDLKGKTVHHFTSANEYPDVGSLAYPFPPRLDNDWKRGAELATSYFKSPLSANDLVASKQTSYSFDIEYNNGNRPIGLKLGQRSVNWDAPNAGESLLLYIFEAYRIESGWKKVTQEITTSEEDDAEFRTITSLLYQNPVHLQPTEVTMEGSDGSLVRTTYKYKDDVTEISGLTPAEIAGIEVLPDHKAVIEEKQFKSGEIVSTKLNIYQGAELKKIKQSTGNSPLEEKVSVSAYDQYGNIQSYTTNAGVRKSYLYGYGGAYPVAEVINAESSEIYVNSFEEQDGTLSLAPGMLYAKSGEYVHAGGSYTITGFSPPNPAVLKMSYWYWNGSTWVFSGEIPYSSVISSSGSHLDEIRVYPAQAQMTTYTYDPGKGVSSITDVNNVTHHYQYDNLGRLYLVRDDKGNILSTYQYYYKQ